MDIKDIKEIGAVGTGIYAAKTLLPETIAVVDRNIANLVETTFQKLGEKFNLSRTENIAAIEHKVSSKLQNTSIDKCCDIPVRVGVPALQAASYCADSDELRNMFASLLVKSIMSDSRDSVHPSFVEIIKQFSSIDAQILNTFTLIEDSYPICHIRFQKDLNEHILGKPFSNISDGSYIITNVATVAGFSEEDISMTLCNLIRLGVIVCPEGYLVKKERYESLENNRLFTDIQKDLAIYRGVFNYPDGIFTLIPAYFNFTPLGKSLLKVCIL